MKKIYRIIILLSLISFVSCKMDFDPIDKDIKHIKQDVDFIQNSLNKYSEDIITLNKLAEVAESNDHIIKITDISKNGKLIGYTIEFQKSGIITIYNGKDGINGRDGINGTDGRDGVNGTNGKDGINGTNGKDGINGTDGKDGVNGTNGRDGINGTDGQNGTNGTNGTDGKDGKNGEKGDKGDKGEIGEQGPQGDKGPKGDVPALSIKADNNLFYWALDGEFLLDANGNKIQASKVSPKIRVYEGKMQISYDNGDNWIEIGEGKGPAPAEAKIKDVQKTDSEVVFTLADNSKITIPISSKDFYLDIENIAEDVLVLPKAEIELNFTLTGADDNTKFIIKQHGDYVIKAVPEQGNANGKITIRIPDTVTDNNILIKALASDGRSSSKIIRIEGKAVLLKNAEILSTDHSAKTLEVEVSSNVENFKVEPQQSWISYTETRSFKDYTIVLAVEKNTEDMAREGSVLIKDAEDNVIQTLTIRQETAPAPVVEVGDLVFEELFYTSMLRPSGKDADSAFGDQYMIIRNNSDKDLYLDGLGVTFSKYYSQIDGSPDSYYRHNKPEGVILVKWIYTFPGSGKVHKIKAGASVTMAINAVDFKTAKDPNPEYGDGVINPNGLDLSKSQFTIENSSEGVDYSAELMVPFCDPSPGDNNYMHDRGYESYTIIKIPKDITTDKYKSEYIRDDVYETFIMGGEPFPWLEPTKSSNCYGVPIEWVIDGVNCGNDKVDLGELDLPTSIDGGIACVTDNNPNLSTDNSRYGKAVRRKSGADGKLIDTNNSTNDFERDVVPSKQ